MTLMAVSHNCKLSLYPHTPEEGEPKRWNFKRNAEITLLRHPPQKIYL